MTVSALTLTRKLLGFDTINPPGNERECAHYLGNLLEAAGYETRYYELADKRSSLIARLVGTGEKLPICFTGHLDTVPLGSTPWSQDPFVGETDGDKIYGRGTSDMKSGVAAIVLMALRVALEAKRRSGITLILTAGEETTCEGSGYLASLDNVLGKAGALIAGEPSANVPYIAHHTCLNWF
jgi:succinyl-diaminopimelate desuccinylase